MLLLQLAIAIQLSVIPFLFLSSLPSVSFQVISLIITMSVCLLFYHRSPKFSFILFFMVINFVINLYRINEHIAQAKSYKIGKIYTVKAKIVEIVTTEHAIIVELYGAEKFPRRRLLIKLNWNNIPEKIILGAGQYWAFKIKIDMATQRLNYANMSVNRLLVSRNIWITAKVLTGKLLISEVSARQTIYNKLNFEWMAYQYAHVFGALIFGVKNNDSNDLFQQFQYAGIAHLIAISGLHLQLLVNHFSLLFRPIVIILPKRYFSAYIPFILSWFLAMSYSWLAGWSLPTQRALITFSFYVFSVINGRKFGSWSVILFTNTLMLLWNPLAILSNSFWLSCVAVIGLAIFSQFITMVSINSHIKRRLRVLFDFISLQFFLSIIMLPLTIFLFYGTNLFSLVGNLISIPLFSYLLLPLLFIGLFSSFYLPYFSQLCWQLSEWLLFGLSQLLVYIQPFWLNLNHHTIIASFSLLWVMIIWRLRFIFLPLILTLAFISLAAILYIPKHYWRLDMLDVGHGLAILITRGNNSILYDTGASWGNYSEAKRVIIPFLNWSGFKLQKIIISHEDNDHVGGLAILKQNYPNIEVISSSIKQGQPSCLYHTTWNWEKLNFNVLWPKKAVVRAYNKDSCVIAISDGKHTVLLTGDIERAQELAIIKLIKRFPFSVDILQVPHHGSQTSSSMTFLANLKPKLALISNAKNRQNKHILQRYNDLKIPYRMTNYNGQITLFIYRDNWCISTYHQYFYLKWYNQVLGNL